MGILCYGPYPSIGTLACLFEFELLIWLCDLIRYKGTADSIYVKYRTAERRDGGGGGQAEICLHRCTKCYQCYLSIDLLAGHKLLDQCVPQPIQASKKN